MFISVNDAAALLSVDPRTIKRYINAGHLDAGTLPGGDLRLSRAQVIGCIRPLVRKVP